MYRQLRSEFSGRIATVTLARPDRRNALSAELMREMIACAQELAARRDLDVVLVTGAAGVFSAGADLKVSTRWAGGAPLLEQREIAGLGQRMARAWEELPQITIAAIEGYAVGGGLALAVALDWRVMARDAFVTLPEISLGIPLTWGTLPRLVNLVGPARAKRLAILGERVAAEQARNRAQAAQALEADRQPERPAGDVLADLVARHQARARYIGVARTRIEL